jgi:hypothetical protein
MHLTDLREGTGPAGELVGVMGVDGMWTAGELGELVVARAWVMEVGGLKRGMVATAKLVVASQQALPIR